MSTDLVMIGLLALGAAALLGGFLYLLARAAGESDADIERMLQNLSSDEELWS